MTNVRVRLTLLGLFFFGTDVCRNWQAGEGNKRLAGWKQWIRQENEWWWRKMMVRRQTQLIVEWMEENFERKKETIYGEFWWLVLVNFEHAMDAVQRKQSLYEKWTHNWGSVFARWTNNAERILFQHSTTLCCRYYCKCSENIFLYKSLWVPWRKKYV